MFRGGFGEYPIFLACDNVYHLKCLGHYVESHGLVANNMYDQETNLTFTLRNGQTSNPFWFNNGSVENSAEPIWVTNQRQSTEYVSRKSGVMFWPGSEVDIGGIFPTYWHPYNQSYPFRYYYHVYLT